MNCTVPFTKDIKFNTSIVEITSISLEHDYTLNEGELLGNFTITGDYKAHEVSVNKEHFEKVIPFSVAITNKIDEESLEFAIDDFTYEVIDNNTLRVNIEYQVTALEVVDDEELADLEDLIDESIGNAEEERTDDDASEEITQEEVQEETTEKAEIEPVEETREETLEEEAVTEAKEEIMNDINSAEETFVTYNIHIMQETDTIDAVCAKYNTTESILNDYNDLTSVAPGVKIVIPDIND